MCGVDFETKIPQKKYCSDKCKSENDKLRYEKENTNYYRLRFQILERDGFRCQYCGLTAKDGIKLQIDHINPKSNGGKLEPNNLTTSCEICNLGKSDVILKQHKKRA